MADISQLWQLVKDAASNEASKWGRGPKLAELLRTAGNNPVNTRGIESIRALMDFVPGIGDALSAKDAVAYADEGKYGLAALSGAGALPLFPSLVGVGMTKTKKLAGLLDSQPTNLARKKTQYELAHELAQRNAALPVEQGGLGLPANNTAMDRAKAMGFDTNKTLYHGSPEDMQRFEYPAFLSDNPDIAEIYANKHNNIYPSGMIRQGNVKPLLVRGKEIAVHDADGRGLDKLGELLGTDITNGLPSRVNKYGYDRATINGMYDLGGVQNQYVIPEGKNIRSRFAAFDPMKRDSADLLAGVAPWAVPAALASLLSRDEQNSD